MCAMMIWQCGRWDAVAPSRMSREDNDKHHAPQERSKMLYSSLLSISSPRLKYRHSTSPESPTIVHIGVRCRWRIVSPTLVTDAEIKSNEFDTISGWKRCWHAWAKPTPASRFSHARQRFYRTITLLALHIPQKENKVLRTRFVGRRQYADGHIRCISTIACHLLFHYGRPFQSRRKKHFMHT